MKLGLGLGLALSSVICLPLWIMYPGVGFFICAGLGLAALACLS